ncbi:uncharacterized protein LOC118422616 isoform X1 [Branchiostoma floridae]|uniref:Uncharacterized protein LOC118422616 isoform X1 n=1 Tax=Branchiostoma floridae TaxID=7739 RepID=A0A9J7LQ94_BRAFL|nr:uncharacterized protein LOC118422616 isoform X1 [Branchiostoma floridae]XP_035686159.1 uncharacterized protein LOC118422616 isoform X1 [Branchiostoma floridae]
MATITHAHAKHPPRQQENVVPGHSMNGASDDHLPSYLPEDELDAFQETIPSNSQEHLLHLANPEHFTSSEDYGDLYRSSSNSSNKKVLQPGSLSSRYPSSLPESDEDTERLDINHQSHLSGNAKLHARSGRHPSVKTENRKPLNGVKKSYMKQVTQGDDRNSNLYSGLGSLSSCLSNSIEDKVHVSVQKTATAPVLEEVPLSSHRGSSIPESVGRISLTQQTLSGDSVDSCQSAKTAFAQELGEASREKSLTKANSKNSHKDQLALSVKECPEGVTEALRNSPIRSEGAAKSSPWQQDQMPNNTGQQTPMQTHTNTPPTDIPVTSLPTDSSSSAEISESLSGSLGQSLGPTSGWSVHLPGNGMRMEVPKSKSSYSTGVKEEEKSQQDRSMLRSLFSSQVTSHLSEEELVNEAKMTALIRIVQEKPIYLDSHPDSLLSQLSDLIFQNQENEPASGNSFAPLSLRSMVSQSLGTIEDMLSITSSIAENQPGAMAPSRNQSQGQNPSGQSRHYMTNDLLSTIFISQPGAAAARTNEQNELLTTLQSATARLSLVQEKIQSDKVGEVMKNGQESQQHRHARIMDILERLCPESLKQVLVSAAYCYGKCKEPNCMLAHEVLSYLVECVKEGTVLRCRGCCAVLSHLLHHHVPRCTERRCLVPYCVHLQTGTPSSVQEAVRRINAEIGTVGLYPEIVVRTSDPSFQGLAMAHPWC